MKNVILAGALCLVAHSAFAAPNVANVTQLGSVLAFPYVAADGSTDTVIRITNANSAPVNIGCAIVDGGAILNWGPTFFTVGARASLSFLVGLLGYYPGGLGQGFMVCWATNTANSHQINWNFLAGTARIISSDPQPRTAGEYSAWSFAARTGSTGSTVGLTRGMIELNGTLYDACPQYVLGQYSPGNTYAPTPDKGSTTFTGARFAVMPCDIDLVTPWPTGAPFLTTVTLTIMNEYGTASGSPVACIGSWYEAALPNKSSYATTNTVAFRAESRGGAYACSGLLPKGLIGTVVGTATMSNSTVKDDPDLTASSLTACGSRTGFIKWRE